MDKSTKKKIKELKKEKNYNEIFVRFGSKAFRKYAPRSYRKEDLDKLIEEGKYEDIYNKYSKYKKDTYKELLKKAMFNEIKEAKGNKAAYFWYIRKKIANILKYIGLTVTSGTLVLGTAASTTTLEKYVNAHKYEDEIEAYNDNIKDYAKEVQAMKLNDTQIFMKLTDDLWENIQGYAKPEKDIRGFLELDLATEEGYGVCRNMASDMARKLNEINKEYNARTMVVSMEVDGSYKIADIERTILETNETVKSNVNEAKAGNQKGKIEQKEVKINKNTKDNKSEKENNKAPYANHMIVLVDIPNKNLTVMIDPTNPMLGIYLNGEIIILNPGKVQIKANEIHDAIGYKGIDGTKEAVESYMNSFRKPSLTFEEIEERYGLEAQNKALREVRAMKKTNEILKKDDKVKKFKEQYETNIEITYTKNEDKADISNSIIKQSESIETGIREEK